MGGNGDRPRRRRVLRLGGALLAGGLAGCKLLPDAGGRSATATVTPAPVPTGNDAGSTTASASATATPPPPAPGVTVTELLGPPEGDDGAHFGAAVAIDGDRALVGAPRDRFDGATTGAAYVFRHVGRSWRYVTTLRARTPAAWAALGRTVALEGDWILVGAPGETHARGNRAGTVHVFEHTDSGWTPATKLYPADGQGERFGTAIALHDGVAIVGSTPLHRVDAPLSGSAYVFERRAGGWEQTAKLRPAGGDPRDVFGDAVCLRGDRALVSAPRTRREADGARAGAVYVFERRETAWSQAAVLTLADGDRDDPVGGDAFGESLALVGHLAIVGARGYAHRSGERAGAVVVFERSGADWSRVATLLPPDGAAGDRFAHAVAIEDGTIVAGAPGDATPDGEATGAAYLFEPDGGSWTFRGTVRLDRAEANDRFGAAVALDGDRGLIGAVGDTDLDGAVGSAAVLDM